MVYIGDAVSQLDGSTFSHSNCVAACTSVLGDCSSLGYWNVKPATIRKLTGDTSGGLTYDASIAALKTGTGGEVTLTVLYWAPQNATTSTLDNLLDAPRVVAISILAAVTRYTPFNTGTYTGRHNVAVGAKRTVTITRSDGTTYRQKQAYVMDPGHSTVKWVWWPWSLLIKAALASTQDDSIHVYYTRDLKNVARKILSNATIRSTASSTSTNTIGTLSKGTTVTVLDTVKGASWDIEGHVGKGWSRIGTGKYVNGGRLR